MSIKEMVKNPKAFRKVVLALVLCFVIALTTISVLSATNNIFATGKKYRNAYEHILDRDGFIFGVNFPYYDETNWFGEQDICDPAYKKLPSYDDKVLSDTLQNCRAMGINSINFWMFQWYAGIEIDEVGNIIGFDEYFEDNLIKTLEMCRKYDMTVSLVSYCHPGEWVATQKLSNYLLERIMQPIVNPEIRQQYIEKLINPICDIVKDYEDIVIMFDVFAEPESTIDGSNDYAFSTDWETTYDFIKDNVKAIKKKLPDMPVTCASGWGSNMSLYNNLGLDIIGTDVYTSDGSVYDPSQQTADAPVVAREFGHSDQSAIMNDETHIAHTTKFFTNAINAGYAGAYIWLYSAWTGNAWSITASHKDVNSLRPVCGALTHYINDKILEHRGFDSSESTTLEKPKMLGISNPLEVKWFSSRGADKYTIEYSSDNKNWTVLADGITPDTCDSDGDSICQYEHDGLDKGGIYYYRVKAEDNNGETAISDAREYYIDRVICEDTDNLLTNYSFETGDLTGWEGSDLSHVEVLTADDGTHYVHFKDGKGGWPWFNQKVDVEPNTDYIVTVVHRMDRDLGGVMGRTVWKVCKGNLHAGLVSNEYIFDLSDEWVMKSITVNSGDEEFLNIVFGIGNSDRAYVDAVYFFKK